jgi:ribosomal protein S18 acetylase RimI-like enzyme
VGYALVQVGETSPTWPLGERGGEVETLAVLPEERSRGVGAALLAAAYERLAARGATTVSLHILVGNDDGARFYAREGFRPFAVALVKSLD